MTLVIERPTVSFATLARVVGGLSARELVSTLSSHKYKTGGPARSYQNARSQAIDLFVERRPLDDEAPLRPYERDAVRAMQRMKLSVPAGARAFRPRSRTRYWVSRGVHVSMQPDVELLADAHIGAVKFSFTKRALPRDVGSVMATLLWHWMHEVEGEPAASPEHFLVYEPRLPWVHRPGKNRDSQMQQARDACEIIAAVWPTL